MDIEVQIAVLSPVGIFTGTKGASLGAVSVAGSSSAGKRRSMFMGRTRTARLRVWNEERMFFRVAIIFVPAEVATS